MSGTEDLRAGRESRADVAQRAGRPGLGDAVTRMVNAAIYRATRRRAVTPAPHGTDHDTDHDTDQDTAPPVRDTRTERPSVTTAQVWRHLAKASFAVVSQVTPDGAPRSSGVLHTVEDGRLYVVVAPDSWKARHIAADGRVAVTVPVRRGGLLAMLVPIPPATISFHGRAVVHPPGTLPGALARLVPAARRAAGSVVEITPEGEFVLYGIGVSLMAMRNPATARARVPVSVSVSGE